MDERLREREFGILDRLTHAGIAEKYPEQAEMRRLLGKFYPPRPAGDSVATGPTTSPSDPTRATLVFASDAELAQMPDEIKAAEKDYDVLQERYLPNHPSMKEAAERIVTLKTRYLTATRLRLREADTDLTELRAAKDELDRMARNFAEQAAQYSRLEKDKADLQEHASVLGNRIRKSDLDEDAGMLDITIVEAAKVDARPTRPNPPLVAGIALGAGLAAGLMLSFLRHQSDPNFRTSEELESSVGLPILGALPSGSRTAGLLNPANAMPMDRWSQSAEVGRQNRRLAQRRLAEGIIPRTAGHLAADG